MAVKWFKDDDVGYLQWCRRHPGGYVANTRRKISPDYLVLHKASCTLITMYPNMDEKGGGFTARRYSKVCSDLEVELRSEFQRRTGKADPFSGICRCVNDR